MAGVASACPQCGAPLKFGGAQSLAAVCAYCRATVARSGADLTNLGKMPDLVATDTRLALGDSGKLGAKQFQILGHLQLDQGAGAWDEWYVGFSDGGYGWLAEAGGRLYATRHLENPGELPRLKGLFAGQTVHIKGVGDFAIDEVAEARFVAAAGELPFKPDVGARYAFSDASGEKGEFLTLDYGAGDDDPALFAGRQVEYGDIGLADKEPPAMAGRERAHALDCPSCGAPLAVRQADTQSLTCPSCRALIDASETKLEVLAKLAERREPALPLGLKGKLRGEQLEVIGHLRRGIEVDGETYEWSEYLLHGRGGYRWLSEYNGHWLYLWPIPGGKVKDAIPDHSAHCDGRRFAHFQTAEARYVDIQGEFYWKIDASQKVRVEDYVAAPFILSAEREKNEINWTRGEYLEGEEIWKAFSAPGEPPRKYGVGAAQPNPYGGKLGRIWLSTTLGIVALLLLALVLSLRPSREAAMSYAFELSPAGNTAISEPFELSGGTQAIKITADASISHWAGLDITLVNVAGGVPRLVGLSLAPGEAFSSRSDAAVLGSVPNGTYQLRIEPRYDGTPPSGRVHVDVRRGAFLATPLVLAFLALLIYPIFASFRYGGFEHSRWAESDHG